MSKDLEKDILAVLGGQDLPITDVAKKLDVPVGPIYSALVGMESDGRAKRVRDGDGSTLWTAAASPKEERGGTKELISHMKSLDKLRPNEIEHPEKLSEEELETLVFAAIDAEYRTYGAIKRHAGLPLRFDLESVISTMMLNLKIREESAGSVQAFFRYNTKPLKCWLVGDGRVSAEFDPSFAPRDERAKATEFVASNTFNQAAALNTDWVGAGKPRKERRGEITAADVRRAAATVGTKAGLAKALSKPTSAVYYWLSSNSELQTAFEEGRAEWLEKKAQRETAETPEAPTTTPSPKKKRGGYPSIEVDPDELRKAASTSTSQAEAATKLNISLNTLRRRLKENAELRRIFEENLQPPAKSGRKPKETEKVKEKVTEAPARERELEYTIEDDEPPKAISTAEMVRQKAEPIGSPVRSNIAMEISEQDLKASAQADSRPGGIDLKFEFGNVGLVHFQGDLISMPRRERDFLNDIIDVMQRHRNGTAS